MVPEDDELRRYVDPGIIQKETPEHIKSLEWKAPKGPLSPRCHSWGPVEGEFYSV